MMHQSLEGIDTDDIFGIAVENGIDIMVLVRNAVGIKETLWECNAAVRGDNDIINRYTVTKSLFNFGNSGGIVLRCAVPSIEHFIGGALID